MEGSVNSNGVGEAGSVAGEVDVAVGITGRGVFVDIITAVGEIVCSSVGVAGVAHAERPNTTIAIDNKLFFMFTISLRFVTATARIKFHLQKHLTILCAKRPTAGVSGGQGTWREKAKAQNPPDGAESLWAGATPPARPLHAVLARFFLARLAFSLLGCF